MVKQLAMVGLVAGASTACSAHTDVPATGERGANVVATPSGSGEATFTSVRLTSGGGLCDKANGCRYSVEVDQAGLRFTSVDSVVQEAALQSQELADVKAYAESPAFREAVASYDSAEWVNVVDSYSEMEVTWDGASPILMTPVATCITCEDPNANPIRVLSQKVWDLKLKYTGDGL